MNALLESGAGRKLRNQHAGNVREAAKRRPPSETVSGRDVVLLRCSMVTALLVATRATGASLTKSAIAA